ncbi:hypothetical protein ILFOPFJJ_01487 [Ensifer psoraleae]|uniref:hypothetical protein n=1 Tax=Sinorhizobium psoraleae TaxID=520838 RepID=UPI001568D515|nr:hypothetical protein [Sinorhizobium psoraleae]NRP70606.1 hypothetical protein [Sinorhizobium psoraleae]
MADISITAANVAVSNNAVVEHGTAGTTVTAGQVVYKNTATGKYELADADSATAAVKRPIGVALNGASNGQPLAIQKSGDITIGGTLVAGTAYYLSPNPGGIAPLSDVLSGDDVVLLGLAKSTTILSLDIQIPGVTL